MPKKSKTLTFSLIAALTVATPVFAQQEGEGRHLALLAFSQLDSADRGFVDQGEFLNYGGDVFYSMDSDENNAISLSEYLNWDFGMLPVAQEVDREDAYYTALRIVFSFWDRNGNGEISQTEQRKSLNADFARADLDNDATLNEAEFTGGFSVMVALRAAINPVPVE